jgi:hypothetical protein
MAVISVLSNPRGDRDRGRATIWITSADFSRLAT